VLLVGRSQRLLVDDLDGLFGRRQREPDGHEHAQPRIGGVGQQAPLGRDAMIEIVDDQRRIDQRRAVVGHQRRRLDDRVEGAELLEMTKHRDRMVFERQVEQLRRNGDTAHERGIQHADQLHRKRSASGGMGPTTVAVSRRTGQRARTLDAKQTAALSAPAARPQ